jgi:hypothetical protein
MIPSEKATYSRTQKIVAKMLCDAGTELSKAGKLYIGDGHVSKPLHDLSRIQGRRMLYRGVMLPREKLRPGANGFTVLHALEHSELGRTQDVLWDAYGPEKDGDCMMTTSYALRGRIERRMRRLPERIPLSDNLITRGFTQRPYSDNPAFLALREI